MSKNYKIDKTDLKILDILTDDAKKSYAEIGRQVYVSTGTVHVRIRKLEEMGLIEGATLKINYAKLGFDITAFIGIFLEKSSLYDEVFERVSNIPEIVSIHYTTGNYSMFLKMHCRDTQHLRKVLHDRIQRIDGIERTETIISLEESLHRSIQLRDV